MAAAVVITANELRLAARSRSFFWADDYAHLLFSRDVNDLIGTGDIGKAMTVLLDGWGRPLMTLAYLPGALLGDGAVRATSLALCFVAAALCAATARRHGLAMPLLGAVLLLAQPLAATLGFSALPATLFTALLVLSFWLRARGNLVAAALVISFLPLVRLEGVAVIGLCALLALRDRQRRPLLALGAGAALWVALSALFANDPLWPIHSAHTTTLASHYPNEPLTFVFDATYVAFGPVVAGLALASPFIRRFPDPLVPLTAGVLILFYGAVWSVGAFQSLPHPVYLVTVSGPVALCAHSALSGLAQSARERVPIHHVVAGALFVAGIAASGQLRILVGALAVVGIHQLVSRDERAAWMRPAAVAAVLVVAVVFSVALTEHRPATGTPTLVALVRAEFSDRLDDVLASNDPTFLWEIDPAPLPPDRQNETGTLLIWNPVLARHSGGPPADELERLGFRRLRAATDGDDTLEVWERVEVRSLPR